jgi:hypothetical protein
MSLTASIAKDLANGVKDILDQAGAVITGGQDEYIRSGSPKSTYGKVQQATARQACRRYADDPSKFAGRGAVLVEKACRPYLDDIGYGDPPTIELPFFGGQCAGVNYRILGDVFNPTTGDPNPGNPINFGTRPGPLELVEGPFNPGCTPPAFWQAEQLVRTVGDPSGAIPVRIQGCVRFTTLKNLRFERIDGLSDDCGSPPPEIVGPVPPSAPGPSRERYNPGPDIDIDIGVDIKPDGTIDVDFGTGPINIDPFGDDESGSGGSPSPAPGDIGEAGESGSTGDGGDAEGTAPEGSVLGGISIAITIAPPRPNKFSEEVFRGVGFVYMGVPGNLALHPEGSAMKNNQFFFPYKDNLTSWLVRANVGYTLQVTPYYLSGED